MNGSARFEEAFQRIASSVPSSLRPLLREVHDAYASRPPDAARARSALVTLFTHLVSPDARTHTNVCAVDRFLMEDPALTKDTALPPQFVEFVLNADALHDTIESPEVAENFESTPEQLLEKARKLLE
jgi:hypothetical protein